MRLPLGRQADEQIAALIPAGVPYLNDSGATLGGLSVWGSPVQPWFYDWAFNRQGGADIRRHWELMPEKTETFVPRR